MPQFECLSCGLVRANFEDEICTACYEDMQTMPEDVMCDLAFETPEYEHEPFHYD